MENAHSTPNGRGKVSYSTANAAQNLIEAMEQAIRNMTEEIKKPIDPELTGSARKAELSALKETALACKELIIERQRLSELVESLNENGGITAETDYRGGFAEKFVKK